MKIPNIKSPTEEEVQEFFSAVRTKLLDHEATYLQNAADARAQAATWERAAQLLRQDAQKSEWWNLKGTLPPEVIEFLCEHDPFGLLDDQE